MSEVYVTYLILTIVTFPDLERPQPRHHELFVLADPITSSEISHYVTGDLVSGMYYESKPVSSPDRSEIFHSKEYLYRVLKSQAPPPKQKAFNIQRMKTEQVKADGSFYEEWEERPRMRRCTEWTPEQAIPALYADGVLEEAKW
ncbi:hypothetical protein CJF32_00007034 [Rutstroemia sp. NJR-2017a WRK4]|nr:hypothetical protein CJF32_00007034 [Rutstroemia sp. NJR-2017a WRK4]